MEKSSKVIVFSGGCFSGKTTAIEYMGDYIRSLGKTVAISEECMRPVYKQGETIDSIRSDFRRYLDFEIDMISEKIKTDLELIKSGKYDYVLIDRSLTDSLFYYTFYVDKSKFGKEEWERYSNFYNKLENSIIEFCNLYSTILQFEPLDYSKCDDKKFRPQHLQQIGNCEYRFINRLNLSFPFHCEIKKINFNYMNMDILKNYI